MIAGNEGGIQKCSLREAGIVNFREVQVQYTCSWRGPCVITDLVVELQIISMFKVEKKRQ